MRLEDAWEVPPDALSGIGIASHQPLRIPASQARWDAATLTLYWSRPLQDRDLQSLVPSAAPDLPDPVDLPPSAVLRYSALASTHADPVLGAHLVLARGNTHFQVSAVASGASVKRGLASVHHRQPAAARQWIVGEYLSASPDPLGGAAVLQGLTVSRDFSLRPGFDPRPRPSVSGLIEQPGVIEVYSNGALLRSTPVQPGPYEWGPTGAGTGAQDLRFVFRAPDGSTRDLSRQGFYGQSTALGQGVSDYSLSMGQTRQGQRAWQGYYRQGITPRLTMGVRSEGQAHHHNHGLSAQVSVSTIALDAALAQDDAGARAWSASLVGGWGPVDAYASRRRFDQGYWKLGQDTIINLGPQDQVLSEDAVGASWSGRNASIHLQHGRRSFESGQRLRETTLQASFQQSNRWRWTMGATHQEGLFSDRLVALSLSIPLDKRIMVSARAQAGSSPHAQISATRTPQSRFEWSATATAFKPFDDHASVLSARATLPTHIGTASLDAFSAGSATSATVGWAGSIVAVGGRVGLSSAYPGGFAWVRSPSTPDAIVLYNNQPMGRVGEEGLIVDNLPSNAPVRIKLDPATLPLRSHLTSSTIEFLSSGIGVATIDLAPVRGAAMALQVSGPQGPVIRGTLVLSDGTRLLVGSTGKIWIEGALPQDKSATWHGNGGPMACVINEASGVDCSTLPPSAPAFDPAPGSG